MTKNQKSYSFTFAMEIEIIVMPLTLYTLINVRKFSESWIELSVLQRGGADARAELIRWNTALNIV